jgi:hypothetical protein
MRILISLVLLTVLGLLVMAVLYVRKDVTHFDLSEQCNPNKQDCAKIIAHIKTAYDEGKDLSKAFLTLVVAVFVASITFSEKIIDFKTAGNWTKVAMIACWGSLLLSIVSCGTGIVYLASVLEQILFYGIAPGHHILWSSGLSAFREFCLLSRW